MVTIQCEVSGLTKKVASVRVGHFFFKKRQLKRSKIFLAEAKCIDCRFYRINFARKSLAQKMHHSMQIQDPGYRVTNLWRTRGCRQPHCSWWCRTGAGLSDHPNPGASGSSTWNSHLMSCMRLNHKKNDLFTRLISKTLRLIKLSQCIHWSCFFFRLDQKMLLQSLHAKRTCHSLSGRTQKLSYSFKNNFNTRCLLGAPVRFIFKIMANINITAYVQELSYQASFRMNIVELSH